MHLHFFRTPLHGGRGCHFHAVSLGTGEGNLSLAAAGRFGAHKGKFHRAAHARAVGVGAAILVAGHVIAVHHLLGHADLDRHAATRAGAHLYALFCHHVLHHLALLGRHVGHFFLGLGHGVRHFPAATRHLGRELPETGLDGLGVGPA